MAIEKEINITELNGRHPSSPKLMHYPSTTDILEVIKSSSLLGKVAQGISWPRTQLNALCECGFPGKIKTMLITLCTIKRREVQYRRKNASFGWPIFSTLKLLIHSLGVEHLAALILATLELEPVAEASREDEAYIPECNFLLLLQA
jgi:hypothetical protein